MSDISKTVQHISTKYFMSIHWNRNEFLTQGFQVIYTTNISFTRKKPINFKTIIILFLNKRNKLFMWDYQKTSSSKFKKKKKMNNTK